MRFLIVFLPAILSAYQAFPQIIPAARTTDWTISGYEPALPSGVIVMDVTGFGAVGDGLTDNFPFIQAAMDSLQGMRGILYFPPGDYVIRSSLNLPDSIILQGATADSTRLLFDLGGTIANCINITGDPYGSFTDVVSGAMRNNNFLVVADTTGYAAGTWAELLEDNGPWDTQPVAWADQSIGQIVQVSSVSGDTLFIDKPLRITYDASLHPRLRPFHPARESGVECLGISRQDSVHAGVCINIYLNYAVNCWIHGVESSKSIGSHFEADNCSNISVNGCYIHHAYEYDGVSTHGYGITLFRHTGQCRIENNIMQHLRHSFSFQCGANGNVLAYNYSTDPNRSEFPANYGADISLHGHFSYANLFEGNIVQNFQIDQTWGPTGPFNTVFRNRMELFGILMSSGTVESDSQNFVGNDVPNTNVLMGNYVLTGNGHFEYGNTIRGSVTPSGTSSLNDSSLYLVAPPPLFPQNYTWPVMGPLSPGSGSIPARDRFMSGQQLATCTSQPLINGMPPAVSDRNPIQVYPQPARELIFVFIPESTEFPVRFSILDLQGRICSLTNDLLMPGLNSLPIRTLAPGHYFLRIESDKSIWRKHFVRIQ